MGVMIATTPIKDAPTTLAGNLEYLGVNAPAWAETVAANWVVGVISALCLAVYLYFLWWTGRKPIENTHSVVPNMPLHNVIRYLAQHSAWGSRQAEIDDDNWILGAARELFTAAANGHVRAFGRLRIPGGRADLGYSEIPKSAFNHPDWDAIKMVTHCPPTSIRLKDGSATYHRVSFIKTQVIQKWPKRSLIDWIRGNSAIDRLNRACPEGGPYKEVFAKQDLAYNRALYTATIIEEE